MRVELFCEVDDLVIGLPAVSFFFLLFFLLASLSRGLLFFVGLEEGVGEKVVWLTLYGLLSFCGRCVDLLVYFVGFVR